MKSLARLTMPYVVVAAVLTGASALLGHFSAPHHRAFNWEVAALAATAIATGLLAAVTWRLARASAADVRETGRIADLTLADQEERARPFVVATLAQFTPQQEGGREGFLHIELMNVGLGPAVDVTMSANYTPREGTGILVDGNHIVVSRRVLPALAPYERFGWGLYVRYPEGVPPGLEVVGHDSFTLEGHCFDRFGERHDVRVRGGRVGVSEEP